MKTLIAALYHVVASSEYLIKEEPDGTYTVSKWDWGKEPSAVYRVRHLQRGGYECSCPSRRSCKHMQMLSDWVRKGKKEGQVIEARDYMTRTPQQ